MEQQPAHGGEQLCPRETTPCIGTRTAVRGTNKCRVAYLIWADLYRYDGARGLKGFFAKYLREPGFRFTFWMRLSASLGEAPLLYVVYLMARWERRRLEHKFGITIPHTTCIGPGLFIGHFGGIVVHGAAVIGRNCNLSHDVTIGQTNRGDHQGCPVIGDSVYLGPGSKVIGRVIIGSNVAIGANAVVTHDVQDGEVVAGVPARVISHQGSVGYINWTDYDREPRTAADRG